MQLVPLLLLAALGCAFAAVSGFRGMCGNQATEFHCVGDGKCIPRAWTCDGAADCSDGEDEDSRLCTSQCNVTQYQCKRSGRCIESQWLCDGMCNCRDQCDDEDHSLCANRTCGSDQFSCSAGQCISLQWKCDGKRDCTNGADEDPNLCGSSAITCPQALFSCSDGKRCISQRWVCDGENDCADGSDEATADCRRSGRQCPADQFRCVDGSRCIPTSWICDGDNDCRDSSDENKTVCAASAPSSTLAPTRCTNYEFACRDGSCISATYQCDGDRDCTDGGDEERCNKTCGPGLFKCMQIHQCIPSSMQCDGRFECLDHTDELGCPATGVRFCDVATQFNCTSSHDECIDRAKVCDNHTDCFNMADEEVNLCRAPNPCDFNNGSCSHLCKVNSDLHTRRCECNEGYKLDVDGLSCIDVDECTSVPGACSHKCINMVGSYACECLAGFAVDPAQRSLCKAIGERPYLLFANRNDIRQLRLSWIAEYTVVVNEGKAIVAMDIDSETSTVYYADSGQEVIASASVAQDSLSKILVSTDVGTVDGLAYDWIYKRIYWTDAARQSISSTSVADPHADRILLVDKLLEPRAIALYPHKGRMFFSDWGNKTIYSAGMDGEHTRVIINKHIEWPNGLAIDMVKDNLYWIDAKLKCIQVSDFEGNEQRVIIADATIISHPFAIAVFEDTLYWSDWIRQHIASANKFTGGDMKVLLNETSGVTQPMDLKVNHRLQQPFGVNHCDSLAQLDRCAHMCYPALHITLTSSKVSCKCRQGYRLDEDRKSCVQLVTSTDGLSSSAASAAADNGNRDSFATAQLVAIVVVCTLLPVLGAIAVVLLRRRRNKGAKRTANFDNPVYHKTTDDKVALHQHEQLPSRTAPPVMVPLTSDDYTFEGIDA